MSFRRLPPLSLAVLLGSLLGCSARTPGPVPKAQAPTPTAESSAATQEWRQLAEGEPLSPLPIEADDARLGSPAPKVTVVGFLDFQCPYCADGFRTLLALSKKYKGQDVRFVFKHLPLDSHQLALPAAIAGQAVMQLAGSEAFFDFARRAFDSQASIDFVKLARWAEEVGITRAAYNEAVGSDLVLQRVARDAMLAESLGVSSTPSFFVNGRMISGAQSEDVFAREIEDELLAMTRVPETARASAYAGRVTQNTKQSLASALLEDDPKDYLVPIDGSASQGPADALVTIVMFSDYECPYCKRAEQTMNELRKRYAGLVRVVFKHHPLPFHESALPSARLAEAVRSQRGDEEFFAISAELFAAEGPIPASKLRALGKKYGLTDSDLSALSGTNSAIERRIERDGFLGDDVLANGTPHFFINGKRLAGARPLAHFEAIVDVELERAKARIADGVAGERVYESLQEGGLQPGAPVLVKLPAGVTGPTKGPKTAAVTIHIFSDFQCPYCKQAEGTLIALNEKFPGQLRFVWHNLPLDFHARARPAARAAIEAYRQQGDGGFWKMHAALFGPEGQPAALTDEDIVKYGAAQHLDLRRLQPALEGDPADGSLARDEELASALGIRGTPAFVVGGYLVTGARDIGHFERLIRLALAASTDTLAAAP